MRGFVWHGAGDQRLEQIAEPVSAAPGEIVVAVAVAGVCGSDVSAYKGVLGISRPGTVRGHEFGGTVVESAEPRLPVGTRIAVDPVIGCGRCGACARGRRAACERIELIGVHRAGGFADRVLVPAGQAHAIPDAMGWEQAASCEPLAQALHDVRIACDRDGSLGEVAVIGVGSIGHWVCVGLAALGTTGVTVVDPDPARRDAIRALGLAARVEASSEAIADGSIDTVFDVVGRAATRQESLRMVRSGGTIVQIGLGEDLSSLPWFEVVRREITIRGANCFDPEDYARALTLLADGRWARLGEHRIVPFDEAESTMASLASSPFPGKTFFGIAGRD
jgi:threonine dehydrogenase-like Zn-dependent dehydrogenase